MSCLNTSQGLGSVFYSRFQGRTGSFKASKDSASVFLVATQILTIPNNAHKMLLSPALAPHGLIPKKSRDICGHMSRDITSSGYSAPRLRPLPHSTQKGEKLSFLSLSVSFVGVTGFEPATSSSRTKRATKLRHTPRNSHIVGRPSVNLKITCLDFGGCHTKAHPETRKSHLEV